MDQKIYYKRSHITQPAILTASVALWRLWRYNSSMPDPNYIAGHSLGEYSALVCAGSISLEDAAWLVYHRGMLMSKAVAGEECLMAAVLGLDADIIKGVCENIIRANDNKGVLELANFNTPEQIVLSGHKQLIEQAKPILLAKGARKVVVLAVSVPSHFSLMKSMVEDFLLKLNEVNWSLPSIPVIHNVNAAINSKNVDKIINCLVEQIYSPVLWYHSVNYMISHGVNSFC